MPVVAGADDSAAISGIPDNAETGPNGQFTFTASSSAVQSATFEFSAPDGTGSSVSTTAIAAFIPLSGEGQVVGQALPTSLMTKTTTALKRERSTPLRRTAQSGTRSLLSNSERQLVTACSDRVINEDAGEVVSYNDYRVDNDGQNSALALETVRELNTTDRSVGSGFAVQAEQAHWPGRSTRRSSARVTTRLRCPPTSPTPSGDSFA
ncbi:MAG: hypothetical protein U5K28_12770 [Halobacteriales archaeon]|nr:hypothetical protein [Halobacteriales archaeon]